MSNRAPPGLPLDRQMNNSYKSYGISEGVRENPGGGQSRLRSLGGGQGGILEGQGLRVSGGGWGFKRGLEVQGSGRG